MSTWCPLTQHQMAVSVYEMQAMSCYLLPNSQLGIGKVTIAKQMLLHVAKAGLRYHVCLGCLVSCCAHVDTSPRQPGCEDRCCSREACGGSGKCLRGQCLEPDMQIAPESWGFPYSLRLMERSAAKVLALGMADTTRSRALNLTRRLILPLIKALC